ncbi:hypothetical protein PMIT1327_01918 [Prochlorococcus marinus str. MIT 1327]|nr:hypothetical protein PMIT1312_02671 [Prochlorococcus marinus str. MIT 1312]KZR79855.1 hypothetical protein PMIT1327_01918 [Prochlorococcus marinus str. MIT 1327]
MSASGKDGCKLNEKDVIKHGDQSRWYLFCREANLFCLSHDQLFCSSLIIRHISSRVLGWIRSISMDVQALRLAIRRH